MEWSHDILQIEELEDIINASQGKYSSRTKGGVLAVNGKPMTYCDCPGQSPWPEMLRIHVGGETNRFYICRHCGTIRENVCRADGTIIHSRFHRLESADLPAAVVEQAREILHQPRYEQGELFKL